MDFFKGDKDEMFRPVKVKSLRKNVYTTDQVGKSNKSRDKKRKALAPGKRISKTGNVYYETRKNRSDLPGKRI